MTVSDQLAILAGKLSASAIRTVGAGLGSNLPGRIARTVSPGLLSRLTSQRSQGILAVTGTNGKSTTSGFVYSILDNAGFKTVHNRQGANLVTGITASMVNEVKWGGRLECDYCLFEIDEAALPVVAAEVKLDSVLVTNLFRDQLDRFGELDTTKKLIEKGILKHKAKTVLNADDPNVAQLAPDCQRLYFGIESLNDAGNSEYTGSAPELSYCSNCGEQYSYKKVFYGQLGHYQCTDCGSCRPTPEVFASQVELSDLGSRFKLHLGEDVFLVEIRLPGLFNVYNALAAAALAHQTGVSATDIAGGLKNYSTLFGRSERIEVDGKSVLIQLIKNPAGASQVVKAVTNDAQARILIAINDNLADGRDISWLWDAEFELLADQENQIVVSGQRAEDMAVRMKYAGFRTDGIKIVSDLDEALSYCLDRTAGNETLWILPTYTCLLNLQKIFKKRGYRLSGT